MGIRCTAICSASYKAFFISGPLQGFHGEGWPASVMGDILSNDDNQWMVGIRIDISSEAFVFACPLLWIALDDNQIASESLQIQNQSLTLAHCWHLYISNTNARALGACDVRIARGSHPSERAWRGSTLLNFSYVTILFHDIQHEYWVAPCPGLARPGVQAA